MAATDDALDLEKKRKELDKLTIDIANAKASLGLERFKAWAALLGPIMTAVTVLGTVYLGFVQLRAKADADEDASWRQTITAIDELKPEDISTRHVATLLKPFLDSPRYRTLAVGVTVSELPKIRDLGTFNELFSAALPHPAPKDLSTTLDIARTLTGRYVALSQSNANLDEKEIVRQELQTLCGPVEDLFRKDLVDIATNLSASGKGGKSKVRANNIWFERCDFSKVDFSEIDLTSSTFDYVKLDDAILSNIQEHSSSLWAANIWWTAKTIDADLLSVLLANFKPYVIPDGFVKAYYRDNTVIDRVDWERNIRRLCSDSHLTCTDQDIHADFPKNP